MEKQNFFADVDDALAKNEALEELAFLIAALLFVGIWIGSGSFWFALLFALLFGPTIGGLGMMIIGGIAMMFARRDSERRGWWSFLLPLLMVISAASALNVIYLLARG